MRAIALVTLMVGAALAGCASNDAPPALATRHTPQDSVLLLTVDSVSEGFRYGDLLIFVDNEPFKMAPRMDFEQRLFEVQGKDTPDDELAIGDLIRLPAAGRASVELRHAKGASLQQFDLIVPDHKAPVAPDLVSPQRGASSVPRVTTFHWGEMSDPSGIRYQLEYWPALNGAGAPATSVPDLAGGSYATPSDQPLLPQTTYRWHVRAVDGAGNVGPWSAEWEFTTAI